MFKILSKKEYEEIKQLLTDQDEAIKGLIDSNNSLHKEIVDIKKELTDIDAELHPKYFNQD